MRNLTIVLACALTLFFGATASASVIGFSSHALWAAAAGSTTLETFDGLSTGAITSIPSVGVTSMSGINISGSSVGQFITSQFALPFPMFTAGDLPSSPNFISNDMRRSGGFASGSLTFSFGSPLTAVGAFVADSAPLGGFSIELFDGSGSLGSISVGPRTLPDSFVGIVSTTAFTSAKFAALSSADSWGLDNLEVSAASSVPEPATHAILLGGLGMMRFIVRRRKQKPAA